MMHVVEGGAGPEAYHTPEDCRPGYACWTEGASKPKARWLDRPVTFTTGAYLALLALLWLDLLRGLAGSPWTEFRGALVLFVLTVSLRVLWRRAAQTGGPGDEP